MLLWAVCLLVLVHGLECADQFVDMSAGSDTAIGRWERNFDFNKYIYITYKVKHKVNTVFRQIFLNNSATIGLVIGALSILALTRGFQVIHICISTYLLELWTVSTYLLELWTVSNRSNDIPASNYWLLLSNAVPFLYLQSLRSGGSGFFGFGGGNSGSSYGSSSSYGYGYSSSARIWSVTVSWVFQVMLSTLLDEKFNWSGFML